MPNKDIIKTFEVALMGGSAVYGLTNLYTILGIIILVLDLGLIILKIVTAVRDSINKNDTQAVEQAIQDAKEQIGHIQEQLPKETTIDGERTE